MVKDINKLTFISGFLNSSPPLLDLSPAVAIAFKDLPKLLAHLKFSVSPQTYETNFHDFLVFIYNEKIETNN